MTYKTLEGVLHPDGTVTLPPEEMPAQPVRVMVTLLEADEETALSALGDYLDQVMDYEGRLARGEVKWQ